MDINLVKNVINEINLDKIGHFGENGQNWVILGVKMTSYIKIWGKWSNNFPSKFLKIFSVRFMDINLVKNVINGVNLVKIGHFGENGQNCVILCVKMTS